MALRARGCEKVLKDFQGDDLAKVQRKKPVFYSQASEAQGRQLKSGR